MVAINANNFRLAVWIQRVIGETDFVALSLNRVQGCWANSYDGNCQKVVRISPLVRISPTMQVEVVDEKIGFLLRILDYFLKQRLQ